VAAAIERLEAELKAVATVSGPLRYRVDWREESPGFKYSHWELRGVPYRLEVGPRDVAANQGVLVRRVDRDKQTISLDALAAELPMRLTDYQQALFQRALDYRAANTHFADTYDEFKAVLDKEGGFLMAPWCGDGACEKQVNADTGATIRVIPFDSPDEPGKCIVDGKPSALQLPASVELEVVETEPGVKGDTVSNVTKPATLETGAVVTVPMFVNIGERIKVDTREARYISRA